MIYQHPKGPLDVWPVAGMDVRALGVIQTSPDEWLQPEMVSR